jgi:hypothetical protein
VDRPQRNDVQGLIEMDDGLLIYSSAQGSVISLNASARRIWQLCDGNHTEQEICQSLAGELGVSEEDLLPDIQLGLNSLRETGLIS